MNALATLRASGALRRAVLPCSAKARRALRVMSAKGQEEEHKVQHKEKAPKEEGKHIAKRAHPSEDTARPQHEMAPYEEASAELALPPSFRNLSSQLMQMQKQMNTIMHQFFGEELRPLSPFGTLMMPRGLGLFDLPVEDYLPSETAATTVAMEVQETDKAYIMSADVPGFSKDEVQAFLTPDGVLNVKGEHKQAEEKKEEEGRFLSKTRRFTAFNRSFRLPKDACTEGITAAVKDGVLSITVPKVVKEEVPHKDIPIM